MCVCVCVCVWFITGPSVNSSLSFAARLMFLFLVFYIFKIRARSGYFPSFFFFFFFFHFHYHKNNETLFQYSQLEYSWPHFLVLSVEPQVHLIIIYLFIHVIMMVRFGFFVFLVYHPSWVIWSQTNQWFGFFVFWHINLHRLSNAKSINVWFLCFLAYQLSWVI